MPERSVPPLPDPARDAESEGEETMSLLRSAAKGDEAAWAVLYHRHRALMRAVLHGRIPIDVRRRFDTEDIIQSAFLSACQQIETFEYEGEESFKRWLNEIVLNKLQDKVRHHRRERRNVEREDAKTEDENEWTGDRPMETPSVLVSAAESQAAVLAALDRLPPDDQELLCLRFFDKLSWSEIADQLGIGETTARRRGLDTIEALVRMVL